MTSKWKPTPEDRESVNMLLDKHVGNEVIWRRVKINLADRKEKVTKAQIWRGMISMRLTSRQSSGPKSAVAEFNKKNPYPLSYDAVEQRKNSKDREKYVANTIKKHGAHYTYDQIGKQTAQNFYRLTEWGKWGELLEQVNRLTTLQGVHLLTHSQRKKVEREVARYLDFLLLGIGPKQARNVLQELGLTRFEIPLDSRFMIKWLRKETTFPKETLDSLSLSQPLHYEFILDEIQHLCESCNEYPCLVDAAVFVNPDKGGYDIDLNAKRNWPRPNAK